MHPVPVPWTREKRSFKSSSDKFLFRKICFQTKREKLSKKIEVQNCNCTAAPRYCISDDIPRPFWFPFGSNAHCREHPVGEKNNQLNLSRPCRQQRDMAMSNNRQFKRRMRTTVPHSSTHLGRNCDAMSANAARCSSFFGEYCNKLFKAVTIILKSHGFISDHICCVDCWIHGWLSASSADSRLSSSTVRSFEMKSLAESLTLSQVLVVKERLPCLITWINSSLVSPQKGNSSDNRR